VRIGYARVSTDDQTLLVQLDQLKAAGCEYIYAEKRSGKDAARPELRRLMAKIRPRDVVVVTKLDRLARSTSDLLNLYTLVAKAEASIYSLSEPWADTTSPAGALIVTVMAGIAEFERARILERCNEGRRAARLAGKSLGRKPCLSAVQVQEAVTMMQNGRRPEDVAALLGVGRSLVYRIKRAGETARPADTLEKAV